jgi:sugar-specific transcriptional regulator TrmB
MMALQSKDEETRQVTDILDRQKKALMKDHAKMKKTVKDKARELLRVKGELNVQKVQNEDYRSKIEEMVRQRQNINTSNIQPY